MDTAEVLVDSLNRLASTEPLSQRTLKLLRGASPGAEASSALRESLSLLVEELLRFRHAVQGDEGACDERTRACAALVAGRKRPRVLVDDAQCLLRIPRILAQVNRGQ
jgi:hypothetical protein